ncbi:MAG TPA: PrgI family protein [Candidatus Dormibacteraeota bacterium]|nr:PrgI family protein [Candidatus Dormibacteraeota bacterium]
MKTATVPAQITTVEDKIAGNLTLQQASLLASPLFVDFALYAALPTTLKLNAYKLVLMIVATLTSSLLAVRVRGRILLAWAITMLKYNARPRYYVFDKNNTYFRSAESVLVKEAKAQTVVGIKQAVQSDASQLSVEDVFKLEHILAHPSAKLSFATSKKGILYASVSEIE